MPRNNKYYTIDFMIHAISNQVLGADMSEDDRKAIQSYLTHNSDSIVNRIEAWKVAEQLDLMDDTVFSVVVATNKEAMEEIYSAVLGTPVQLKSCQGQVELRNLNGRSVVLDSLAKFAGTEKETYGNAEVQVEDRDDYPRRMRYNLSMVRVYHTPEKAEFGQVPDLVGIFISSFDPFKKEQMVYDPDPASDERIYYINSAVHPDFENYTDPLLKSRMERIQRMMLVLTKSDDMDFDYFPCLSGIKKNYREKKVGVKEVSDVIQNLISAAVADQKETIREKDLTILEQNSTIRKQNSTIREMSTENARLRAMLASLGVTP